MSDTVEPEDKRNLIYKDLHSTQLSQEKPATTYSSERVLEILFSVYKPNSVLDVGCGLGVWLKSAAKLGVSDLRGIEGEWINPALLEISPELIEVRDLEKGFDLKRKFDLVITLEVAEHLSESAADDFIASLVRHAPAVLFSAAIPFQGGDHHVNERFLPYWAAKFERYGYRPVDLIRSEIWLDESALLWLRQNVMLFAHEALIAGNERLRRASLDNRFPFTVVHPEFYVRRVKESEALRNLLKPGGFFHSIPLGTTANFEVVRVTEKVEAMQKLTNLMKDGGFYSATSAADSGSFSVTKANDIEELKTLRNYMQSGGLFHATPSDSAGGFRVERVSEHLEELQRLRAYISNGGLFRVTIDDSGTLTVAKLDEPSDALPASPS